MRFFKLDNELRVKHDAIKASCVELLKKMLILYDTPSLANKDNFVVEIGRVREAIINYLELIDIDPFIGKNLRNVLRILATDLDPIRHYCGVKDNSFQIISGKALEDVTIINDIVNENRVCCQTFLEDIKSSLRHCFNWLSRFVSKCDHSNKNLSKE